VRPPAAASAAAPPPTASTSPKTPFSAPAQLLSSGRTVVAAVRSAEKASETFGALGISEGRQAAGGGILFTQAGVDVTDEATLTAELFAGVTQARPRAALHSY
jgi:hypothetical protein